MTELAVIVAGAFDAPDLGDAAADAPAAPATKRKRTRHRDHQGDRRGKSTILRLHLHKFTCAFDLFLFGDSFLLCFCWSSGPYGQMVLGEHFVAVRKLQRCRPQNPKAKPTACA
jgi:hypothetical protein